MRTLSLFSGIGGLDLGLRRSGVFELVAHCETDVFAESVYARNFPGSKSLGDVRDCSFEDGEFEAVVGGFPCQDITVAGSKVGLSGAKSGLWFEMLRTVSEVRPKIVVLENVPHILRSNGGADFETVLGGLASIGYDAEWDCVPAEAFGAPHLRERWVALAYPHGVGLSGQRALGQSVHCPSQGYGEADELVDAFQRKDLPWVCSGHDGFPEGLDYRGTIRSLGNAVVPDVGQWLGDCVRECGWFD